MMYQNLYGKSLTIIALVASIGLTACSSGSSSSPDIEDDTGVTGVNLSGKAAKGIIKNGVVVAEELNASKEVIAEVGNTTTGADGRYSLTLSDSYNGGPVQITISMAADTEMKCDVPAGCGTRTDNVSDADAIIDFGEWYKPAALTMTALIPDSEANATINVNVTPFTHMAAERAKAAITLDAAAIADANSEVSNLLGGIDVLNTAPVDITDAAAIADASATEITYAALASAIASQVPVDTDGQPDLDAAIDLLATSFAEGTMLADDSTGDDTAQISLQEIVTAAGDTFTAAGIVDETGVIDALESDIIDAAAGDGTIDPEASDTAGDSTLVQVKAMISDVRTWGNVITAEVGTKGTEFETQIEMASDALDALAVDQGPVNALGEAMDAVGQFFDGTNTSGDLTTYVTDSIYSTQQDTTPFTSGTVSSPSAGVYTITGGVVYGYTINLTANLPEDQTSSASFNIGIVSATITDDSTSMTVNSGTVAMTLAEAYTINFAAMDLGAGLPLPAVTDVTFDLDIELTQSTGIDLTGADATLASPVTFAGSLAFNLDPVEIQGETTVNQSALPSSFELTGSVSNASNSMDMSLVMNVTNTDTFTFEGDFGTVGTTMYSDNAARGDMVTWAYTDADSDGTDDTLTNIYPYGSSVFAWDSQSQLITETHVYDGWTSAPLTGSATYTGIVDFVTLNSYSMATSSTVYVDGEGTYYADLTGANGLITGSVDGILIDSEFVIESSTNWIDADIGLTFTAQLTGLPEARVNITADRTAFEAGDVTTTISYGTKQLAISASVANSATDVTSLDGVLTITNQDNIVLSITDPNVDDTTPFTGTISFNGVDYGTVTESGGFIKFTYADETFEIF